MVAIMQALATPCSDLAKDASALDASISACRSSIKVLESSLNTAEGSSGGWETFAWVCSVVVAIGVAAEIVGIVGAYRDDLKDWRRGIIRPPDRPSFVRFFWFEILATVLVVAGVFGEAWASKELAFINSQLRSKTSELRADSDQLLALVTLEAGDAKQSAIDASGAAGDAQNKAESANAAAGEATQEAQAFHAELSDSEIILRKHIEGIVNSRRVLDEYDASNGDREVRVERYEKVKKYRGTRVLIQVVEGNQEASDLGQDIARALKTCGWNPEFITERSGGLDWIYISRGVLVEVKNRDAFLYHLNLAVDPSTIQHATSAAMALAELLDLDLGLEGPPNVGSVGVRFESDTTWHTLTRFPPGTVFVLIGAKPVDNWWPSKFFSQPLADSEAKQNKKNLKSNPNAKP